MKKNVSNFPMILQAFYDTDNDQEGEIQNDLDRWTENDLIVKSSATLIVRQSERWIQDDIILVSSDTGH